MRTDTEHNPHINLHEIQERSQGYGFRLRHDLANRLQSVKMWVDLIGRHPEQPPGEAKLCRLKQSLTKLERFVEGACTLVKYETIKVLALVPTDLDKYLTEAAKGVEESLQTKDQLVSVTALGEGHQVYAHKSALEALQQVLQNASNHAPVGSEIRLIVAEEDKCVVVEVREQGEGYPEKVLALFHGTNDSNPAVLGATPDCASGFGLFITHRIMALHGGAFWLNNRDGGGGSAFLRLQRA